MKSLSRSFLISVALMSLVMTAFGTVAAFVIFQRDLTHRQIGFLQDYVRERSANIDRRFSNLTALHRSANAELQRRMDHLPDAEVAALADEYFPLRPDGTRRSRPQYFDGTMRHGGYTYGVGAFIGEAQHITPRDLKTLVAAFELVGDFGQAARAEYDNFYFFTPPLARLVMFGPDRPDRLMFYRETAPADLSIAAEEMSYITNPVFNPQRATRCTKLQRLLQDKTGARLATACLTPAFLDGRYVGAFGSSIELTGFFLNAVKNPLPGAASLIVTNRGELIAYPGFTTPGQASEKTIAAYERGMGLKKIAADIAQKGQAAGVLTSPDSRQIVAYGRLSGPDWYLLMTYPKAKVAASAARSAVWVLVVGAAATLLQTLLVVWLARRKLVRPIWRLASSCEPEAFGARARPDVADVEDRDDELGVLARSLRKEREASEALLASLEDRVAERTAQLERATAEKSQFLANMSHELRTPLNGVIAVSESLAREQSTPRGRELAGLIVSSGRLLERVINDILDFSKIEAGEIRLARDEFEISRLVSSIAELHRASAEAKGLAFSWTVAPAVDGRFAGDTVRLTQVLSNLLSNAVKFTETGAVRLDVSGEGREIRFVVSDTGIGFDAEVKARLFRRFEQADTSIRRRFGGTGLGLAISRSLAEIMGGRVEADSAPGRGSTFTVTVPLERLADTPAAEPEAAQEPFDISGLRVLLAEDHPTNQKVVQLVLESVGVVPLIVDNGVLALEALAEQAFDVVLMDMQMPELDGLEATRRLRALEAAQGLARTPVIMLTANALDEHIRAGREAGADFHLAKPIRAQALIDHILLALASTARQEADAAARGSAA
ncbi:ATP-binding protein [Phenylobacterium deserti]|uniref:histidine kinase n=1 Tax=Phenylobacterium deserti TaxID=1914756 RepID=A0A328AV59_9CAUL|nr:ATP-binding protein [Phenylobacterium deserti]RAK56808.1 hybrid sensor histidine kinase/response regulator [Phenylobacterium deserti]